MALSVSFDDFFAGRALLTSFVDTLNFGAIKDGKISSSIDAADTSCLLYQLTTGQIPSSLNGLVSPTVAQLSFALSKLSPEFKNLGCPIPLTK